MITVWKKYGNLWWIFLFFPRLQAWQSHTGLRSQAAAAIIINPVALDETMSARKASYYDVKKTTCSKTISLNAKIIFYLHPQLTFIQVGLNDSTSNLFIKLLWCLK